MASGAAHPADLLQRYADGARSAELALYEAVYSELLQLARRLVRAHSHDPTLQPAALVHETWLRLVNRRGLALEDRAHAYGLASRVLRSVLADRTRRALREKRGGASVRVPLDTAELPTEGRGLDALAVEESLDRLKALRPRLARIVELRFFGGLSHAEIAADLGISLRSVERAWHEAREWLQVHLRA